MTRVQTGLLSEQEHSALFQVLPVGRMYISISQSAKDHQALYASSAVQSLVKDAKKVSHPRGDF